MRDKRAIRFDRVAAFCLFESFGRLGRHEISVVDQTDRILENELLDAVRVNAGQPRERLCEWAKDCCLGASHAITGRLQIA